MDADGPFHIGQLVSRVYEITGVLGAGGMGVVYEARDRHLPRTVALKAARDVRDAAALHREAQSLAAIRSPSFVKVLHLTSHGGVLVMVMERLYGETLDERLASLGWCMPIDEALLHVGAVASALADAHRAGVSQRDVKPSNVVLTGDRHVLVDMGLSVPEVLASGTVMISGSPPYMAPELALRTLTRGGGARVDLYALGVLAFELLTGRLPFCEDGIEATLRAHVAQPVPDVRALRGDVPPELAALVRALLAKDPDDRPEAADDVAWELDAIRRACFSRCLSTFVASGTRSRGRSRGASRSAPCCRPFDREPTRRAAE